MKHYARITGWGKYLPERVLTNFDLEKMVDTTDEWIRTRTGIRERHICSPGETCSTMSLAAAKKALEVAGLAPADVELIIVATSSPDYWVPSVASMIQDRLGAAKTPAFTLGAGCTGWVYALVTASQFIENGVYRNALVIGTEHLTMGVDWTDRNTCVLFGDGSGAVVLEASDEPGIISTHIHADGAYESLLTTVKPGPDVDPDKLADGTAFIEMRGNEVFKMAVNTLGRIVDETLDATGMTYADVDWLVPHQANIRIIQATARKLDLPMDRVVVTVNKHGNTSAASVPLALDTAVRDGRIKRGDTILLEAFGGGFTWGSALIKF